MGNSIKRFLSVNWLLTIYLNIYYLGIKRAFRLPLLFGYGTQIGAIGKRGCIEVTDKFGALCFGLKREPFKLGSKTNYWYIGESSKFIIKGTCRMAKGVRLKLFDNSKIIIGNHFTSNANLLISCANKVIFGDDCLLGWNITIMDNDGGHTIINEGCSQSTIKNKEIVIGNHVWIGAESSILKGSVVSDGSIVGYNSFVCGLKTNNTKCLIIGSPAYVKREQISWKH